jgi:hypothetical protein
LIESLWDKERIKMIKDKKDFLEEAKEKNSLFFSYPLSLARYRRWSEMIVCGILLFGSL